MITTKILNGNLSHSFATKSSTSQWIPGTGSRSKSLGAESRAWKHRRTDLRWIMMFHIQYIGFLVSGRVINRKTRQHDRKSYCSAPIEPWNPLIFLHHWCRRVLCLRSVHWLTRLGRWRTRLTQRCTVARDRVGSDSIRAIEPNGSPWGLPLYILRMNMVERRWRRIHVVRGSNFILNIVPYPSAKQKDFLLAKRTIFLKPGEMIAFGRHHSNMNSDINFMKKNLWQYNICGKILSIVDKIRTNQKSHFGSRVQDKHVQRTLTSFPPLFFLLTFHFLFCQSYVTKHPTFCSLNPINLWVNAMNWRGRSGPYTSHLEWQIDSHSRRINATKHKRVEIIPKHLLGMRIYPAKPMRINQSLFCESILGSFLWVNFVI